MKLLIASDLHGSDYYCDQLLTAFARENVERMVLLGDVLYHGPRNDLPREYAPKRVIEKLNAMKEKILCVRGNCDTEVDQMVLSFPILATYAVLYLDGLTVYATHGHGDVPKLMDGDILLQGHTHVYAMENKENYFYINPGSVAIPKNGNVPTYMTYENRTFTLKAMDGTVLASVTR